MANPEHVAKLREGVSAWKKWRVQNDCIKVDLSGADLWRANLSGAILFGAKLIEADLSEANLSGANLGGANLIGANLIGTNLIGAKLAGAKLGGAKLIGACLSEARLDGAELSHTDLSMADLTEANLSRAGLSEAKLSGAKLSRANLSGADLSRADLIEADLNATNMNGANLTESDLNGANLNGANLFKSDLSNANLSDVDLRSATLQQTNLDRATITGIRLWEAQRAGWSIKGIICERAYWDEEGKEPTEYALGEFERLYSDQTCIELFYQGGVSTFELNTLPALLHHLASLHPGTNIRLKSIEETGGGAKISISVGDADPETAEKIETDARRVYQAQLTLRDKETERLQIEKDYLERLLFGRLIPAMLTAGAPQIVFNAPVSGIVISNDESKVDFHPTINDNSALLALLEKIMDRRTDLGLPAPDASRFESEMHNATVELQKQNPDRSVVSKSIKIIKTIATEALATTVVDLGKHAATLDWSTLLNQLGMFITHLK